MLNYREIVQAGVIEVTWLTLHFPRMFGSRIMKSYLETSGHVS